MEAMQDDPQRQNSRNLFASAKASATSTTLVDIHPVVLLHIADHYHRNLIQHGQQIQAFGALLGRQEGHHAEICFAFEIVVTKEGNRYVLDRQYWSDKDAQFKQVLPSLEYIGWYTVSDDFLTASDLDLQTQISEAYPIPFLIKARSGKADVFPMDLFEFVTESTDGKPCLKVHELKYNLVFEPAEQIGVRHIYNKAGRAESAVNVGGLESAEYEMHLRSMYNAVQMLRDRLAIINQYVAAVDAGSLPRDEDVFIELKRITELLSNLGSQEENDKYDTIKLQALMTASIGNYTQSVDTLTDFIRKNALLMERRGPIIARGLSRGGTGFANNLAGKASASKFPRPSRAASAKSKFTSSFTKKGGDDADMARSSGGDYGNFSGS